MKKTIIRLTKIISFLLLIVILDILAGKILEHLYQTSTLGSISKIRYSFFDSNEDLLIFGASTANHNYIPDTIIKGTGLTAYDCGLGGQPIAFSLIQIYETLKRYEPKIIILDIAPSFPFSLDTDPRLRILGPYYHDDIFIEKILIDNGSKFEKLKYISSIYPYNGMLADLLLSLVHQKDVSFKGFVPIYGSTLDEDHETYENPELYHQEIPIRQLEYLQEITNLCQKHNVDLWIIISPIYRIQEHHLITIQNLMIYAKQHDIHFLDFSQDKNLSDHMLFRDNYHLNINGAIKYSGMVRDTIFNSLKIKYKGSTF
jgi:hypothetical protein